MHPIVRYRTARGLTQRGLAEAVGVTLVTVQKWEHGAAPRPAALAKLADVLGVDSLVLLDELSAWRAGRGEQIAA